MKCVTHDIYARYDSGRTSYNHVPLKVNVSPNLLTLIQRNTLIKELMKFKSFQPLIIQVSKNVGVLEGHSVDGSSLIDRDQVLGINVIDRT